MSKALTFFEGVKVDNLNTWIPANPREKTFLSYILKDGKEIVSRSKAFLAYPKKMETGNYFIFYLDTVIIFFIFQENGVEGSVSYATKSFSTRLL